MANASIEFNEAFYLSTYTDVAAAISRGAIANARAHFDTFGRFEGRNPNAFFNTTFYLSQYPDVANARVNPLNHFLEFGAKEGRLPNGNIDGTIDTDNNNFANEFNGAAYLVGNQDVANAGFTAANAYQHYVLFGQFESRPAAALLNGTVLTGPFATVGQGGGTNPGNTITLTNNVDGPNAIAPAVNTDGSINNDTYISSFGAAQGDFIDGKGGTDTLRLTGAGTATVVLNNVEVVQAAAIGGAGEVNVAGSTGIQTLAANGGSNNITFSGVGNSATLEVTNQSAGDVTLAYVPSVVVGTSDAQAIKLANFGLPTAAGGTISINGIETANITATGTNNFAALTNTAAGSSLQTVNVTGAGSVGIGTALANTVKTFDGSTSTGNLSVAFATGGDVSVKTGSGNDRVAFEGAAGFTTKDVVDLGTGTADTLAIVGSDVSVATNEQLKALNAVKGAEVLEFTGAGAGATLNNTTLTNTEFGKFTFQTGLADTITNAGTKLYAFGNANAGDATFTLAGTNTTLNLGLEATSKTATVAFNDADVGALDTGTALTVNVASTGTTDAVVSFTTVDGTIFNNIGAVTNAANATFNLSGNANTQITSFANAVNLQAGTLTGNLIATGSGADDILVGGTAKNFLTGGAGVDSIDITKSASVAGDVIGLNSVLLSANRDTVSGFQAGANGDIIRVAATDTTATTAAAATIAIQEVTSNTGTVNFLTAANDVLELNFNLSGTTLAASNGANALNGTNLLAAIGTLNVAADTNKGYVVAYQGGNAYVYHVVEGADGDAAVAAADIQLVGTFNGVAVGALDASNFQLV